VNLFEHELKDEELEVVNGLKLFFFVFDWAITAMYNVFG
jgi:hypothetical protein